MVRFLTAELHTLNVTSAERAAILKLRQLLPQLDRSETTALATMLVHSYSIFLGRWVSIAANRNFSQDLATATLQVPALSATTKLGIAIELLRAEAQDDKNETKDKTTQEDDDD